MYRATIVVMLLVLSAGCSDADVVSLSSSEKAELEILYEADKVESIRVTLLAGEDIREFEAPPEYIPRILDAMKPVGRATKHPKCQGIANVKVAAKEGGCQGRKRAGPVCAYVSRWVRSEAEKGRRLDRLFCWQ